MQATDLTPEIWNAIADLVGRSQSSREIYFVKVTKTDKVNRLIWAQEFGDLAIPLVSHGFSFAHYDTIPVGNVTSGQPVDTQKQRREDKTQSNPAYQVEIITPKKGQVVCVLDMWGAKRFPICIGLVQSKRGFWEEG